MASFLWLFRWALRKSLIPFPGAHPMREQQVIPQNAYFPLKSLLFFGSLLYPQEMVRDIFSFLSVGLGGGQNPKRIISSHSSISQVSGVSSQTNGTLDESCSMKRKRTKMRMILFIHTMIVVSKVWPFFSERPNRQVYFLILFCTCKSNRNAFGGEWRPRSHCLSSHHRIGLSNQSKWDMWGTIPQPTG